MQPRANGRLTVVEVDGRMERRRKPRERDDPSVTFLVEEVITRAKLVRERMDKAVDAVVDLLEGEGGEMAKKMFLRVSDRPPHPAE
jgi:hypothetical protein